MADTPNPSWAQTRPHCTPSDAVAASRLQRVLIIMPQLLGDAVLSSVLVTALQDMIPGIRIDILVHQPLAELFRHNPAIAAVHTIDRGWRRKGLWRTLRPRWALIRALRAHRYDLLIQSPHTTDGSWGPALKALLRIPYAVGASEVTHGSPLKRFMWRRLFTHTLPRPPDPNRRHVAELHLDLLRRLGLKPAATARRATIEPGAVARARIDALLALHHIPPQGFVLFAPLAGQRGRTLPTALCRDFLDHCEALSLTVVITSGHEAWQQTFAHALAHGRGDGIIDLAGALTLTELAALASAARVFVGADSGPMHIAAAMGLPVIVCFGPGDHHRFSPWQTRLSLITGNRPCQPCELDGCGNSGHADCLYDIQSRTLLDALRPFETPFEFIAPACT
jgi:heptosyltransferase-3